MKLAGRTQEQVDEREATQAAEQEQSEAMATISRRQAVMARLILWLLRYVWPRLSDDDKAEIKAIIPDEMEQEIKAALSKLP